jgi:hypothetical protein
LFFCLLPRGATAQSCVPYRGSPHTGNKCDSLVTYPSVLLRPNQTYAQVPPSFSCVDPILTVELPVILTPTTLTNAFDSD